MFQITTQQLNNFWCDNDAVQKTISTQLLASSIHCLRRWKKYYNSFYAIYTCVHRKGSWKGGDRCSICLGGLVLCYNSTHPHWLAAIDQAGEGFWGIICFTSSSSTTKSSIVLCGVQYIFGYGESLGGGGGEGMSMDLVELDSIIRPWQTLPELSNLM